MATTNKKSVLIADDQPEMRELLAEKLRGRGKEVLAFPTGQRLIGHLDSRVGEVELVVLDLDFGAGELDGIEVLRQIKERWAQLPVIMLTGKGSIDTAVEAVQFF